MLGPNGSGKTTTFYSVAGLVFPEAGTVTIDGQTVTTLPMYRRARLGIGYLPQEMSIFRGMSVEDNIAAVLDITVRPCPSPQGTFGRAVVGFLDRTSAPGTCVGLVGR